MLQVQLRVEGRRCLVVGGGTVGTRRTRALLDAGAQVVVVDPTPSAELEALAVDAERVGAERVGPDEVGSEQVALSGAARLELVRRPFRPSDVADRPLVLVVAATDDAHVNAAVGDAAQQAGVLVNRSDDVSAGDLAFPAVVNHGPVSIGVSSSVGTTPIPALTRWVAQSIATRADQMIGLDPAALADFAAVLSELRDELRMRAADQGVPAPDSDLKLGKTPGTEPQKAFDWHLVFDESILELVQAGRLVEAKERIFACL